MRTPLDLSTAVWRKSSHSNQEGGACIEVAQDFPGAVSWRKSTYSNEQGGACVEVADHVPGLVPVRDSKDPDGPALVFGSAAWAAFVADVKAGHFPL
ncbi:DUF397 domain-containing protein [Wenjunlia tyrosinilytica]|uniref:Toxin n=1 Tax=Wenjunlia tyrosinilytica TaxID=1544741 RepID=A0A918DZN0_9ACTN|nr:DUF397 domain-containing protein [Wenjunlia tyrosinilytica]GGO95895.1 toxin [Wenjunlia tyrosinilytica]